MLRYTAGWSISTMLAISPSPLTVLPILSTEKIMFRYETYVRKCYPIKTQNLSYREIQWVGCKARRRVRYNEEDEEYGYNVEIAMLEMYSQSASEEALLVKAMVGDQEEEVLIFKGFSSCLSNKTSSDPSKSVLPATAVIKSIDRVKGPFNSSNIHYIEKGITWEAFKIRLQ